MNSVKVLLQKVNLSSPSIKKNFSDIPPSSRLLQYGIIVLNIVADGVGLLGGTISYLVSYDDPPKVEALYSYHKNCIRKL